MNNHRKGINNRFNLQICYDPKFRTFTNSPSLKNTSVPVYADSTNTRRKEYEILLLFASNKFGLKGVSNSNSSLISE